jgi:hypothetical protein
MMTPSEYYTCGRTVSVGRRREFRIKIFSQVAPEVKNEFPIWFFRHQVISETQGILTDDFEETSGAGAQESASEGQCRIAWITNFPSFNWFGYFYNAGADAWS